MKNKKKEDIIDKLKMRIKSKSTKVSINPLKHKRAAVINSELNQQERI